MTKYIDGNSYVKRLTYLKHSGTSMKCNVELQDIDGEILHWTTNYYTNVFKEIQKENGVLYSFRVKSTLDGKVVITNLNYSERK